jgi:two-component system, OmpR family, KDP operon response regulator KdpE
MADGAGAGSASPGQGSGAGSGRGPLVVVIEDDPQIRRFLRPALTTHGFRVAEAPTAQEGLREAAARPPDLVILDLGLPDLDGLEVIHGLREWTQVPIIVLSARGQEEDKVSALEAGADDYLTKPFGIGELLARIRVALRHVDRAAAQPSEPVFVVGDLRVDLAGRRVFVAEREIHLTPIEYKLLTTLVRHAGKVLTHGQLLREVWGPKQEGQAHYVRVYMAHLRHKLETEPAQPRYLFSEPGVGYRLKID